ncbi:MAG: AAA family ATPase [Oscillospiraceae bacterium]|nr:AAA family ATPase [Oscillospiraceae bacterium]
MFTYVRLKNFKSFGDIVFDFRKKLNPKTNGDVKQFIAIYGENGSGKSNLADSFAFLTASAYAFRGADSSDGIDWSTFRTRSCPDITEAEYGILTSGKELRYRIKFNDKLVEEELCIEDTVYKICACSDGTIEKEFGGGVFTGDYEQCYINDEIDKHWGRFSFLSIMVYLISRNEYDFSQLSIPDEILRFAGKIARSCIAIRTRFGDVKLWQQNKYILENPVNGEIESMNMELLKNTEKMLNSFLIQAYSEVRRAFYVTRPGKNGNVLYTLHVDRIVADILCRMPFTYESEGTHNTIELLRCLVHALNGELSVCDGIDCGIHDLLLETMLLSAKEKLEELSEQAEKEAKRFTGQIIFTTHSTQLLNTLDPSDVYLIRSDYRGEKEAVCLSSFVLKKRDDIRLKYINGIFDGVPIADSIDYTFACGQQ